MIPPVYITAVGMACPTGLTAPTACAAIRAGIDRRQELPYIDDQGRPIVGSALGQLPFELSAGQRWTRLLAHALRDVASDQPPGLLTRLPIVVAVSNEPGIPTPDRTTVARELGEALGLNLDPRLLDFVHEGSCGAHRALARARAGLLQGQHPACVVAATDSFIDARRLLALSQQQRLLTEDDSDGITPGEGAACVLVAAAPRAPRAVIRGLGFAREPALPTNDQPMRGDGATVAIQMALDEAGLSMDDMDMRLSDASGEGHAFKELALVTTRLLRRRKAEFPGWFVADSLGDVGAAAGLLGVVTAVVAFQRGYAPGRRAVGLATSRDGGRAAIILDAQRS